MKLPVLPHICGIGYDCVYGVPKGDADYWLCRNPEDCRGNGDARCHRMSRTRVAGYLSRVPEESLKESQ